MTPTEAGKIVKLVLAAWPTQRMRLSEDDVRGMVLVYTAALGDVEYAAAEAAVVRITRTSKWMPTIAEIRESIGLNANGRARHGAEAWGETLALIRRYGYARYPGIDFDIDDPVQHATIRALGWQELCGSENATADRARFIEHYDRLAREHRQDAQLSAGAAQLPTVDRAPTRQLKAPTAVAQDASEFVKVTDEDYQRLVGSVLKPDDPLHEVKS